MRLIAIYCGLVFIISSCNSGNGNGPGPNPPNNPAPVPPATPVTTALGVYAGNNDQSNNPLHVTAQNSVLSYGNSTNGFHISSVNADQYNTRIVADYTSGNTGYQLFKMITTLEAYGKNYADINPVYTDHIATLFNTESGTYTMPGGGQIILPSGSFTAGTAIFSVSGFYLHPNKQNYAVSLPCYPMADENQKRSYLESYGIIFLQTYCADNQGFQVNFQATADVKIRMPIHASQLATAPDSIGAYNLNNQGRWVKNGYAKKVNGFYEKRIDRKGYWNFAQPVNGVYVKIRLASSNGQNVTNTRFLVRKGLNEIAEGRTNSFGQALVFLPAGNDLSVDILNDHHNNWAGTPPFSIPLANYNSTATKNIILPPRLELVTFMGNVFNCDGNTSLASGTATLKNANAKDEYVFHITNGVFSGAAWINYGYNLADMVIRDQNGTELSVTKVLLGSSTAANYKPQVKNYSISFYTCANAATYFSHYMNDSSKVSMQHSGQFSYLTGNDGEIKMEGGNEGISFKGWFSSIGGNYFLNGLKINGQSCTFDDTRGWSEIFITRNDPQAGGVMEGWYSIYYKTPANVSKHITGNFRVRKVP